MFTNFDLRYLQTVLYFSYNGFSTYNDKCSKRILFFFLYSYLNYCYWTYGLSIFNL